MSVTQSICFQIVPVRSNLLPSTLLGAHNTHDWGTLAKCRVKVNFPSSSPQWYLAGGECLTVGKSVFQPGSAMEQPSFVRDTLYPRKMLILISNLFKWWKKVGVILCFPLLSTEGCIHDNGREKHRCVQLWSEWWNRLWLHHELYHKGLCLPLLLNSNCISRKGSCAPQIFLPHSLEEDVA